MEKKIKKVAITRIKHLEQQRLKSFKKHLCWFLSGFDLMLKYLSYIQKKCQTKCK